MGRIDTVKAPKTPPRPAAATDVARALAMICTRRPRKELPLNQLRDRVPFETAHVYGAPVQLGERLSDRMGATDVVALSSALAWPSDDRRGGPSS
ncbi:MULTISPECIES: hypothetical protein [Nonomuraea]|uniref:Uncharacterized protein n=1 Tax=Nonomuraea mangrovi TaxID=2316207 RepID=A0ABW4T8G4_9ACTN